MIVVLSRLFPTSAGLQPEYLSGHIAGLGGIEQKAGDLLVGLWSGGIKLGPEVKAKRLRVDA